MAPDASPDSPRSGRLGQLLGRLVKSTAQLQADDLHDTSRRSGATPIAALTPRQRATVCGEVRSVALRPQVQVPALVVEIYDGTGALSLVWLGRRALAGVDPGVLLRVHGRVTDLRGVRTIYNPAYEILVHHG